MMILLRKNRKDNRSIKVFDGISKEYIERAEEYLDEMEGAIE